MSQRLTISNLSNVRFVAAASQDYSDAGSILVISANLDHLYRFNAPDLSERVPFMKVITIADGWPVALASSLVARTPWPRQTGAGHVAELFRAAESTELRIAVMGGTQQTHAALSQKWPLASPSPPPLCFNPTRAQLQDPDWAEQALREIRDAGSQILLVCLGKPLQELWILEHFHDGLGFRVVALVGGAVDMWAGTTRRAPRLMQRLGLEWAFRLLLEPKRLWKRYLVQGPVALSRLAIFLGRGQLRVQDSEQILT